MRRSIPHWIETEVDPRFEDGEQAWHEDGADAPWWVVGLAITLLGGLLAAVVLCGYLALPPANSQPHPGTPGGPAAPSPYGPPPALNQGMVR